MSEPALTFDSPAGPSTATCTICGTSIDRAYYTVNGQVACNTCRNGVLNVMEQRPGIKGVLTGIGLGSAAGFVGALVWWLIRRFASLEIGLIAIGIGHFVGQGVRRGSGGRGGRGFQVLAVALTYFWITANYVPDIIQAVLSRDSAQTDTATAGASGRSTTPGTTGTDAGAASASGDADAAAEPPSLGGFLLAVVVLFGYAMASPFLMGIENVIGILIISFGLYQAWKLNTRADVVIAGPFRLAPAATAAASTPPPLPAPGAGA